MEWKTIKKKLSEVTPLERNPRKITEAGKLELSKDINRVGLYKPLTVDNNSIIIAGNQRYHRLFEKHGGDFEVEVTIPLEQLSEEQRKSVIILDNKHRGEDDIDILQEEYEDTLKSLGYEDLLPKVELETEDDGYEEPDTLPTKIKLGEVWQLGKHRLMCGDSTLLSDVEKLMGNIKADMVFTDPPYNVDYEGKTKDALKIQNDKFESTDSFYQFLLDAFTNMNVVSKEGAAVYVCHADSEGLNFRLAFKNAGYELKQCLIWNKNTMVMGRQDYQWKHEPILYGWKSGAAHNWFGGRNKYTVWDIDKPSRSANHPTMKPIELITRAVVNSTKTEDLVLDLFGGSGSTLITCEQLNRVCYTMELDEHYANVIIDRWEKLTNQEAIKLEV